MPAADLDHLIDLATRLAREAGALLSDGLLEARTDVETKTSGTDMVTEMDRAAEALIVAGLRRERPGDAIVGEEGAAQPGTTGVRWVVDPLDGTTNYLYGLPAFAVSVAAEIDGSVVAGAVHDPSHGETFVAARGRGATCNGVTLEVAGPPSLATALVGTGFSYAADQRSWQASVVGHLIGEVRDIRRMGAAALDLCWVAAGRLDAFWERGLQPWDLAAGALVASEAGAWVGDLHGGPPSGTITIAAAPQLAGDLRALLRTAEAAAGPAPARPAAG